MPERTVLEKRNVLGKTGLEVTPLCVGTSALGSMPDVYGYTVDPEVAKQTLRRVFEGPINFVDTSNIYGDGASETLIGSVLEEIGGLPPGFVLTTKVDPDSTGDFSASRVRESLRESADRLGMSTFPLVFLHDPEKIAFSDAIAADGAVSGLRSLQDEGLVTHLGVAGGPLDVMQRYVDTGFFEAVVTHNRFTLVDRSAEPLLQQCTDAGVAVINGAPFGGGMLVRGPSRNPNYAYRPANPGILRSAIALEELCRSFDVPLAAAALQFSLRESRISSTIFGITRPERYEQALELAACPIPDELWDLVDDQLAEREDWLG